MRALRNVRIMISAFSVVTSVKLANRKVCRKPSRLVPSCSDRLAIANMGMMNSTSNQSSAGADRR